MVVTGGVIHHVDDVVTVIQGPHPSKHNCTTSVREKIEVSTVVQIFYGSVPETGTYFLF